MFLEPTFINTSDDSKTKEDERDKLIEYYPNYMRIDLENKCDTYINKISAIDESYIEDIFYKGTDRKCICMQFPMKHSSVMMFHNGLLISPIAYFEGQHYISKYKNDSFDKIMSNYDKVWEDFENKRVKILTFK